MGGYSSVKRIEKALSADDGLKEKMGKISYKNMMISNHPKSVPGGSINKRRDSLTLKK